MIIIINCFKVNRCCICIIYFYVRLNPKLFRNFFHFCSQKKYSNKSKKGDKIILILEINLTNQTIDDLSSRYLDQISVQTGDFSGSQIQWQRGSNVTSQKYETCIALGIKMFAERWEFSQSSNTGIPARNRFKVKNNPTNS